MSSIFWYQPFVAVSGNLGGNVPIVDDVLSPHEREIYLTNSLDENCIDFEFQVDRNHYVDLRQSFLALKLKFLKGRGYVTYESKEKKKEHKDESVVFTETGDEEVEEEVARVAYVNNIMHSMFSNVEVYINNQQIYNSNGLCAHKSYISNNFKAAISEYKGDLHCEGYDYEHDPEDIHNPLPDPFFTRRMKLLSRPYGFLLYGKLGIDFFSTSELLYPNMKIRLRLIRARPNFYMISDSPNVSLGIVDCSLYTHRIALKDDFHKKRMEMLAYAPVEHIYLKTLAKTFIKPVRQNQFIQENILNNDPIRRIPIAMNTNSAFTGSFTENPNWYQQFDLRQIRILRGGQPIVDFDTADNCRLYVTTMKALNFQDDIPSIPIDDFKDDYVLVFDLTPMKDATENCHYPELVGEPLRLELNFTNPLENVTELTHCIGWTNAIGCSRQVWCCWKECVKMDKIALQQINNRIPPLKFRYLSLFPSDYVSTLDNDTFAIINTQPSKMQGEHWIKFANFRHEMYFADSLRCKGYSFLNNQHYQQKMPATLQSHPSVCGFYTIYAAFHLFKFQQEEITGVHDVNVLSFYT